jgi:hypothetical protein
MFKESIPESEVLVHNNWMQKGTAAPASGSGSPAPRQRLPLREASHEVARPVEDRRALPPLPEGSPGDELTTDYARQTATGSLIDNKLRAIFADLAQAGIPENQHAALIVERAAALSSPTAPARLPEENTRKSHASQAGRASAGVGALQAGMAVAVLEKAAGSETTARSEHSALTPAAHPIAAVLEIMTLKERRAALEKHYAARKPWKEVRSANPTPAQFLAWLNDSFPDRREIGLVISDLRFLDPAAYKKLDNWSHMDSGVMKASIEAFDLPSKITRYEPERDATAPTSFGEVLARAERGEGTFKSLNRDYSRVRRHLP